jgi:hypothetical protein
MKRIISLLLLVPFLSACGLQEKEESLKKKEAELNQKEQELILKEKSLQFREEEVARKQLQMDTSIKDSSSTARPGLVGTWSTRMTCVETTCTGSAVGDVKTETWIISNETDHIIVKAMAGDQLARVYTGSLNGNTIELTQNSQDNASRPPVQITARLSIKDEKTMEGQREIVRDRECKIVYTLQMQKQNG